MALICDMDQVSQVGPTQRNVISDRLIEFLLDFDWLDG